jgi:putative hemolysin
MALEVALVFTLILANGLFAMSEMAIVAARKSRLQERAERGSRSARLALQLANAPNEFLSTVQIGITVVGTLASAVGGATIAAGLAAEFDRYPFIAPHGETVSLAIVVVLISFVSLIIGELVPKRLALSSPEKIASIVAPLMRSIAFVSGPAVRFLSWSTEVVLRLMPSRHSNEAEVTEEEIKGLINQAVGEGTLHHAEREMLEGVFWLGDRRVNQIMTPRNRVVWLDVNANTEEVLRSIAESHYSSFPVGHGSLDRLLGTVDVKTLLPPGVRTRRIDLRSALKAPLIVPETLSAVRLVAMFRQSRNHMAIAVDEHGNTQGIVTLIDILESIVGDIPAHGQAEPPAAVRRDDGSWLVDGIMPLVEVKDLLQTPLVPEPPDVTTVAGLVVAELGRIPKVGDAVELPGARFEVVDMDGVRVDKLLIRTGSYGTSEPERGPSSE